VANVAVRAVSWRTQFPAFSENLRGHRPRRETESVFAGHAGARNFDHDAG